MKKTRISVNTEMKLEAVTLPGGGFYGGEQTETLPGGGFHEMCIRDR